MKVRHNSGVCVGWKAYHCLSMPLRSLERGPDLTFSQLVQVRCEGSLIFFQMFIIVIIIIITIRARVRVLLRFKRVLSF